MKIAMLAPIAWRTPPEHYGPWELVTSLITEELVKLGLDVTLFATGNSITNAKLESVVEKGYEEDRNSDAKILEYRHISNCMEKAYEFDIIHNQFDFMPLHYSKLIKTPMLTTIHGFSSDKILPAYQKYNSNTHYVSISYTNRDPSLKYISNVYHGIDVDFYKPGNEKKDDYFLFMGRIHPDKGAHEAIQIALNSGRKLILAGIIQDQNYFEEKIKPFLNQEIEFIGSVGGGTKLKLIQKAYAFLHPIAFEEPFGLSVVEAMACGTPVVAYKKGSMPEVIEHGKTGFLVENINSAVEAILKIDSINSSDYRNHVVEKFSKERMAEDYVKVYREILDLKN